MKKILLFTILAAALLHVGCASYWAFNHTRNNHE